MAINILMPALSPTMEQGKLAKWLKREGDKIKSGDILAEIETDKATMEVEAVDEGILAKILIDGGTDNVAVNTPIAIIAAEGEAVSAASAQAAAAQAPAIQSPAIHTSASASAAPIAPQSAYIDSVEIPAGTSMSMMTVREALRDAMARLLNSLLSIFLCKRLIKSSIRQQKLFICRADKWAARLSFAVPMERLRVWLPNIARIIRLGILKFRV